MATGTRKLALNEISQLAFWQALCADLTITTSDPLAEQFQARDLSQVRKDDWEVCKSTVHQDGYFAYESWFESDRMDRLATCMQSLSNQGIPPIFCFVFDEFWELFFQLRPMLEDLVGEYWLLPAVWAWHVTGDNQSAFAPHRDQVRDVSVDDDEHLDYLTIWIPLTDLNHLTSYMCVLPASADPDYDAGTDQVVIENLQDIRALQGPRGSVFCWTTGLVHWGTRQSRLGQPRMSVGVYIQNPEAECYDPTPMDFDQPFPLECRLALIGQQIIHYSRDADNDLLSLSQALIEANKQ